MMTLDRDVDSIAPLDHETAMVLAAREYDRVLTLVRDFGPAEWEATTGCPGWDVRTMVSHIVGMAEALASPVEFVKLGARASRRPEAFVDGMTSVQVEDRRDCTPTELIERFERAIPAAIRTRVRLPRGLRALPLRFRTPTGDVVHWNVAYLHDVILTRDNWMHRVDLSRATGRAMRVTPTHDGVLIADVVAEWARAHGQPFRLVLDGEAGGTFHRGEHGEEIGPLDAVDFCRILSGRAAGAGLLTTEVAF